MVSLLCDRPPASVQPELGEEPPWRPMETQVPFGDASGCFSEDDWNLLQEWQKELCGNVMKEIHRALISLGPLIASTVFSLRMKGTQLLHPLDNTESERRDCVTSSPSDQSTSHCELFIKREEHFQLSSPQETEERKDCLSREERASTFIDHLGEEIEESRAGPDLVRKIEEPAPTFIDHLGEEIAESRAGPDMEVPRITAVFSLSARPEEQSCVQETTAPEGQTSGMSDSGSMLVKESTTCCENKTFIPKSVLNKYQILQIDDKHTLSTDGKKVFKRIGHRLYHQKYHTIKKRFPCTYCGKSFTQISYLLRHQRTHTGERPFSCTECPKSFTQLSVFQSHHRSHTVEKPYLCTECGKSFTQQAGLTRHQKIHTGMSDSESMLVKESTTCCENKTFIPKSVLNQYQILQIDDKHTVSTDGKKVFKRIGNRLYHQKYHTIKKDFPCSYCGKSFTQKSYLLCHQRTHTGEKPFSCTECPKSFTQLSILQRHHRSHTGEKPYRCTECGKSFTQQAGLKRHQNIHTGETESLFHCSECGKCFVYKSDLQRHQRIHIKKSFMFKLDFQKDQRIQNDEKSFPCTECGKCFTHQKGLKRHMNIHKGAIEKPFPCSQCGKSFVYKSDYLRHERIHFKKSFCGMAPGNVPVSPNLA